VYAGAAKPQNPGDNFFLSPISGYGIVQAVLQL
jgi:hypothetical protein